MTALDRGRFAALVEFLRDCPGRLSAAIVPDAASGQALVEELQAALAPLPVERVVDAFDPLALGRLAAEGSERERVLAVELAGHAEFSAGEAARDFWRRLNHQRERLAAEPIRTCFVLEPAQAALLAGVADDLDDWTHVFDFVTGAPLAAPVAAEAAAAARHDGHALRRLDLLRDQCQRARDAGLPPPSLARDYAWPLFVALMEAGERAEALAVWRGDLRSGELLDDDRRTEGQRRLAAAPPDTVAFAHLCDLHFRADVPPDPVHTALLDDLAALAGGQAPEGGVSRLALDFILISGDVAWSGRPDEYAAAEAFLRRVCAVTGVPETRVFLVPGNHDVDREEHDPALADYLEDGQRLAEFWASPRRRRRAMAAKLAAYRAFAQRLNPELILPDDAPGGFFRQLTCAGRRVAVLGLSSAWLAGGERDAGRLLVGREQATELIGGYRIEGDLRLVLMHHPLGWLRAFDQADIAALLAPDCDLLLHGHVDALPRWPSHARRLRVAVARGLHGSRSEVPGTYNLVRVTFGARREATLWARVYDPQAGCFTADRTEAGTGDGARVEFDLDVAPAPAKSSPALSTAEVAYLERLVQQCRRLELRGGRTAEILELERVFTRVRVVSARAVIGGDERRSHENASDLHTFLSTHGDVVLVGDPGSGKTMLLRFMALQLARPLLGAHRGTSFERLTLQEEPLFPVLVRLGDFQRFLRDHRWFGERTDSVEDFYAYLDFVCRGFSEEEGSPVFLRDKIQSGGCWLLLDGLDEVPTEAAREAVMAVLRKVVFAGRARGNRHIITCRTRAYRGRVQLGPEFTRGTLLDFGPEEIEAFVSQWSRALFRVPPGAPSGVVAQQADAYGRDLLAAIRSHPAMRALPATPLLLTLLAVVHWSRKKLPEQRAEIYDAALDYLLESRKHSSRYPSPLRRDALKAIALRLFEGPEGVRRTLTRREAAEAVAPLLGVDVAAAEEFIEDEALHSGILVSRIEGEIEFWHIAFAEYLAALELAWAPERIRLHLFDERWSEVVLLVAACLRREGLAPSSEFVHRILALDPSLEGRARAVALVGRILRDILPFGGDPAAGTGYDKARQEVLAIFEPGSIVSERVRIEVGEALGVARDPRIHDDDHANRVFVRGGTFGMGAQNNDRGAPGYDPRAGDDEGPVHRVTLSDFWIDRYPVTVAQFRRFVEGGRQGYGAARFWPPAGWEWRVRTGQEAPRRWEQQLRYPNRPVTGVNWYEAMAYCAWLSAVSGWAVRLPTEAQWEYAARGAEGRPYPWGNVAPDDQHANFGLRVGEPTPVGIYPLGATPEGVQDLAGNVLEWCADVYAPYTSEPQTDPLVVERAPSRVQRGGAFDEFASALRAAARVLADPLADFVNAGLRCVVSPRPAHAEGRGRVFLSCSHKDRSWADSLEGHLGSLAPELVVWDDAASATGGNWRAEIERAIESAEVAVLLVTPDFLASSFITEYELPALFRRAKAGALRILPVYVRPSVQDVQIEGVSLDAVQALNDPARPLSSLRAAERERALAEIAQKIITAVRRPGA